MNNQIEDVFFPRIRLPIKLNTQYILENDLNICFIDSPGEFSTNNLYFVKQGSLIIVISIQDEDKLIVKINEKLLWLNRIDFEQNCKLFVKEDKPLRQVKSIISNLANLEDDINDWISNNCDLEIINVTSSTLNSDFAITLIFYEEDIDD